MILIAGRVGGDIVGSLVVPLFEVGVLILEGVGELVGEDRLLVIGTDPVEHIYGLGFGVVIGFDLLLEEYEQKRLELEIVIEEAEFLEDDFVALQALGAFILIELFFKVLFDGVAGSELALDGALDGQTGFVGGELDEHIDQGEELAGLLGRDFGRRLVVGVGRARRKGCNRIVRGHGERGSLLGWGGGATARTRRRAKRSQRRIDSTFLDCTFIDVPSGAKAPTDLLCRLRHD